MATWLIPRESLTPEQIRAVELDTNGHKIITGSPGSGKTIILLHRANYLVHKLGVSPDRFRIFVFTNVLTSYIRSAIKLLKLPESTICTFDSWCIKMYFKHYGRRLPQSPEGDRPDFQEIRRRVKNSLQDYRPGNYLYDFALVDEGQDLSEDAYLVLQACVRHITVFMDHKQQLYEDGAGNNIVAHALSLKKVSLGLLEAYRCSPYIVRLAAAFIDNLEERQHFINQTRAQQVEKETPVAYIAKDHKDELVRLIDIIQTRQHSGDRIAILVPHNLQVADIKVALAKFGLNVELKMKNHNGDNVNSLEFDSDLPKIMPYHSAKGITFDTVLMPRLEMLEDFTPETINRLIYVGITRATKWVYMSAVGDDHSLFKILRDQDKLGTVSYQRYDDGPTYNAGTGSTAQEDSSDDIIDLF